jgi:predicted tellurium resistance membrane protein TerC
MDRLHKYLQTTKGRLVFLGIPILVCIIGLGFIWAHYTFGLPKIPNYIRVSYFISALIMLVNLGFITWSDNKHMEEREKRFK